MGAKWNFICKVTFNFSSIIIPIIICPQFICTIIFSPINDLLEMGEFTLENLLEEDELIQEVKAKNELLINL
jgi:hypothetical protein